MTSDVLIVGASVGGLTVAEALRRGGHTGRLRLVDPDPHPPYDRPPLSKQVLTGLWPPDRVRLRTPEQLEALDAEWVWGRAERLDAAARTVELDGGRALAYDTLVIATGLVPRRLPGPEPAGAHTLRSLDEALALRHALPDAGRVAVVGAGVLGCEIAAAARTLGREVTLVDPGPVPMARHLGPELGGRVAALHRRHGVRLRLGTAVTGLVGERGRVSGVALADGEVVRADLAVVTIGSVPATAWLENSGLALADGIVCDARCRAAPGVYAVGDVARWPDPVTGVGIRVESRTNATEQALVVAANILGDERVHAPVPYFWSDQYDTKIQVHGRVGGGDRVRYLEGTAADDRFVALTESDGGRTTAAIGWNHPRGARTARAHLTAAPSQP
ncbi:NAD(P)/FAD-dependent oxidoreductase [Actinomadura kijaniata]|uniref:NAD(P)/FAD-dependent oxidoreductase n=1 Tax=Actinomadura kijaniata TaxID=46161 RepID=UPI00083615F7|nr:FAD-dependent oxidoreductase [Actinomadura kijaniata]